MEHFGKNTLCQSHTFGTLWIGYHRGIYLSEGNEYDLFRVILFEIMSHLSDTCTSFFREGCPPQYREW